MQQCCLKVPPHHLNVSPNLWYVLIQIRGGGRGGGRAAVCPDRTAESVFPISALAFCGSTVRTCRVEDAAQRFLLGHIWSRCTWAQKVGVTRHLKREIQVHVGLLWSVYPGLAGIHPWTGHPSLTQRASMGTGRTYAGLSWNWTGNLLSAESPKPQPSHIFLLDVDVINCGFEMAGSRKSSWRVPLFPLNREFLKHLLSALCRRQKVTFPYISKLL